MKALKLLILSTALFFVSCSEKPKQYQEKQRKSYENFISGDCFREYCDFVLDEIKTTLNPKKIKEKSTIFVKTDFLETFFEKYHPNITVPYILVTHNSDHSSPGKFAKYLDEEKLLVWFAQNVELKHDKLIPIPIGIENHWISETKPKLLKKSQRAIKKLSKNIFLYLNFNLNTNLFKRDSVYQFFSDKHFCQKAFGLSDLEYYTDLVVSKFVLSPKGNGIDCHRTWEALYLGAIPIVEKSSMDAAFEDLPVLIVDHFEDLTEEFLEKKYEEIKNKSNNLKKLQKEYWLNLISSYQN